MLIVDNYDLTNLQNITVTKTKLGWKVFEKNKLVRKYPKNKIPETVDFTLRRKNV